ncbi:hypothetical protein [Microbacterium sp. F2]|uniref:hypothetical protein n=1 Tax=Microbacterium sp. F2 TaxID=3422228 RepID=UPI003FCFB741
MEFEAELEVLRRRAIEVDAAARAVHLQGVSDGEGYVIVRDTQEFRDAIAGLDAFRADLIGFVERRLGPDPALDPRH